MRRRKLLATLALLSGVLSSLFLGTATPAAAYTPHVDMPVNRGW